MIFKGYWMAFFVWPAILTLECNIGPRRWPKSNISTSAKLEGQYGLRAVAWATIALMSQTWRVMRKKLFYNLFIIISTMQDFRLQCIYNLLDRWTISSDSNVLLKDGSFEVPSHRCGINNKEVSSSSTSL